MNNFWEKLKDILYDGTDYIIMVVVILIMVLIINWRLDGLFNKDNAKTKPSNQVSAVDKDTPEETENQDKDIPSEDDENNSLEEEDESLITINIPNNSLPGKIGEILVESGLIEDKQEFIDKTVEMNADTKLRSGEFEIPKNSTLEEIVNILIKK